MQLNSEYADEINFNGLGLVWFLFNALTNIQIKTFGFRTDKWKKPLLIRKQNQPTIYLVHLGFPQLRALNYFIRNHNAKWLVSCQSASRHQCDHPLWSNPCFTSPFSLPSADRDSNHPRRCDAACLCNLISNITNISEHRLQQIKGVGLNATVV